MNINAYNTVPGSRVNEYNAFLEKCGLRNTEETDYTVLVDDDDFNLVACGSLTDNVLKLIAVDEACEGQGYCDVVVAHLKKEARRRGYRRLFLYTKPLNQILFESQGFHTLIQTRDILMMEEQAHGLADFLEEVKAQSALGASCKEFVQKQELAKGNSATPSVGGTSGKAAEGASAPPKSAAIVMNANPVTKGHLYLIEKAARENEHLYVFVVSAEGKKEGDVPAEDRYRLVQEGVAELLAGKEAVPSDQGKQNPDAEPSDNRMHDPAAESSDDRKQDSAAESSDDRMKASSTGSSDDRMQAPATEPSNDLQKGLTSEPSDSRMQDLAADPSDDRTQGPAAALGNITICHSQEYLVSRETFPAYFLKESIDPASARTDLDLLLFGKKIAPALGITRRYVGTEPSCAVTAKYNQRMKDLLPDLGIEVIEVPRLDDISASTVRAAALAGDLATMKDLVPDCVYQYYYAKQ